MKERISTENMSWSDINDISSFTANTDDNKDKRTKRTSKILLGSIQYVENFLKGIKQLNAYDASSIIKSESTWLQKHFFSDFKDEAGKTVNIEIGQVCYIDYGKTYQGELSYYHYGLCIGKKEGKLFMIPITSGTNWINDCYHTINNIAATKKFRQGLQPEGFSKDCVLMMSDAKFLSAGRIDKLDVKIESNVLEEITSQLFSVCFPDLKNVHDRLLSNIEKQNKKILEQKELISKLKQDKNRLNQLLLNSQSNQ